ncbi:LuxR C-terminal-related transcriptional regulator [Colwellia sp. 1_MG-2023]|uniref:response regulator transcription factor n=1 Tax=Colwellia sp. 1_MG-2023 TaxID=3062649 RepID=UPI0026E25CCC|nr:LuxR C-terminal-related transcriptional regulator [Colwellia sp. 1_MG-2023]MDO6446197.1 LuxR C-terminal-related transcriptional regulator [Colwellia sp. 1_MG-2023]
MKNTDVDKFISQLYRGALNVSLADFPTWALDLLRQVIPFDGAIWGTGHTSTKTFHTQITLDVSDDIFTNLLTYLPINPIFAQITERLGTAINMSDVIDDDNFYQSELYHKCFKPCDIERILSSINVDERSGIFTLLTLYRYDRAHLFTKAEQSLQSRLLYHLMSCFAYRQLSEISIDTKSVKAAESNQINALCDAKGIYHCVTPQFFAVLDEHMPQASHQTFPPDLLKNNDELIKGNLHFSVKAVGELFKISIRIIDQLDILTTREKEVIEGVCQGQTFKQIAKTLTLSPSTVSNHLYRIYIKLGINTRSELIELVQKKRE